METIKSVIFDWGGVLIDDPAPGLARYCADALGVSKEDYITAHRKFEADFQTGRVSEDAFWERVCGELKVQKPKVASLWTSAFKAVYRPKTDVFELAHTLRENSYRTALLSNTEIPAMEFFYQQGYDIFDVSVFSCAEGTKKPERKIYELTLEKLSILPSQAVLIDNRQDYIDGAKDVGLNTILFESTEQVKKELAGFGVRIH